MIDDLVAMLHGRIIEEIKESADRVILTLWFVFDLPVSAETLTLERQGPAISSCLVFLKYLGGPLEFYSALRRIPSAIKP